MSETAASVIDQQVKALDAIAKRTVQDFNTVLGAERMGQWKIRTVTSSPGRVSSHRNEADELARKNPGPAFTNDLIEEFTDEVECYRSYLVALAKRLRAAVPPASG